MFVYAIYLFILLVILNTPPVGNRTEREGSGCRQPPPTEDGGKRYYPIEFWVNSNSKQVLKSKSESTGFNLLRDLVVE